MGTRVENGINMAASSYAEILRYSDRALSVIPLRSHRRTDDLAYTV